jgi:Protein of unknown function (DUF3501)
MKPVQRSELLDWVTYDERREGLRAEVLAIKAVRRVLVGPAFAFLFENRDTVRYQVHEMMRAEKIVREQDIAHELATYNDLLGGDGELGCTLLIGIDDERERAEKLVSWLELPHRVYAKLADGSLVRPRFDPRQVGDDRLSAVQYFKFAVGPVAPVAIGIDLPGANVHAELSAEQRAALNADLDERS